jgi:hypothetical protein
LAKNMGRDKKRPIAKRAGQKGKGLIRSLARAGTRSQKVPPVEARAERLREPTACERCGAVFLNRTWRRDHKVTTALLDRAEWAICPACEQTSRTEGFGRIVIGGEFASRSEEAIRARIRNVTRRAQFTQPERRVVSIERHGDGFEVLTTSQKLAHRIVHELKKAFRGRASYQWSEDGSLYATWRRDDSCA